MTVSIQKNRFDILIPTHDIGSAAFKREYYKLKLEYNKSKYDKKISVVPTVYGIVLQNADELPRNITKFINASRIYIGNEKQTIELIFDKIEEYKIKKALNILQYNLPSIYLELKQKTDHGIGNKYTKAVIEINTQTIEHIHLIDGKKDNSKIGLPTINILNGLSELVYKAIINERI